MGHRTDGDGSPGQHSRTARLEKGRFFGPLMREAGDGTRWGILVPCYEPALPTLAH